MTFQKQLISTSEADTEGGRGQKVVKRIEVKGSHNRVRTMGNKNEIKLPIQGNNRTRIIGLEETSDVF